MFTIEPPPRALHRLDHGLHADVGADEVDPQQALEGGGVLVDQGPDPVDAGVVHQDVEPAEAVDGRGDHRRPAGHVADVVGQGDRGVAEVGGHGLDLGGEDVGEHDLGPLGDEEPGLGLALAARRAGDDRDLALETNPHGR